MVGFLRNFSLGSKVKKEVKIGEKLIELIGNIDSDLELIFEETSDLIEVENYVGVMFLNIILGLCVIVVRVFSEENEVTIIDITVTKGTEVIGKNYLRQVPRKIKNDSIGIVSIVFTLLEDMMGGFSDSLDYSAFKDNYSNYLEKDIKDKILKDSRKHIYDDKLSITVTPPLSSNQGESENVNSNRGGVEKNLVYSNENIDLSLSELKTYRPDFIDLSDKEVFEKLVIEELVRARSYGSTTMKTSLDKTISEDFRVKD